MRAFITFLILFSTILTPIYAASEEDSSAEDTQEKSQQEENSDYEIERQEEEVLHPVGETNDWSLGGEDLAAEEFE